MRAHILPAVAMALVIVATMFGAAVADSAEPEQTGQEQTTPAAESPATDQQATEPEATEPETAESQANDPDQARTEKSDVDNPLLTEWKTPFGVPPFDRIKVDHYMPAFKAGMSEQVKEIEAITANPDPPTFENTIEALEASGALLTRVAHVFGNQRSAITSDAVQAVAKEVAPLRTKHLDDIRMNAALFERIKAVEEQKEKLELTPEQQMLLEKTYKIFVRGGAGLDEEKQAQLREINEELALLTLKFGDNVLAETNRFEMVIDKEEDLAGLPPGVISAAAEAAKERGHEGKWVFTLHKPSWIPFLQYSEKRELREKIHKAFINIGDNGDELDNKSILARIAALRVKKAQLLGYESHAAFMLDENMAKTPDNVYKLLGQIWDPALAAAKREREELQALVREDGFDFQLQHWDWWYYAEKLRKAKYDLDEEELRPYFQLENVIAGVFAVAEKLYDIRFVERKDIPKYHEDVKVFEVKDADGSHIGILYTDYFPRASKRGGAWMSVFRKESKKGDQRISPIIYNVGNFSKPTGDTPSLISIDEVLTLFHEFGHAMHGMLADTRYEMLSGTDVAIDFVELPSQIMENWAFEPEVLAMYARHYKTGEVIPQELVEKLKNSKHFNQGFATVEYLAASFLDMDWHTLTEPKEMDVHRFEQKSMDRIGLIPEIVVRYRSPYFRHIFSGGYSAGYYSYIWAEVLSADAFAAFKEKGIFDKKTARSFRENILSRGGTEEGMDLYKRFRGAEPSIEPLLRDRGLI